jgi:FixJ family two-component response regulator
VKISSQAAADGIAVAISDDGIGMTPEQREHAFEPSSPPARSAAAPLGLCTARNIVLAHSGRITIDSQPGRAPPFHLHFPTRHDRLFGSLHRQDRHAASAGKHLTPPKYRLLLVDDEVGIVKALPGCSARKTTSRHRQQRPRSPAAPRRGPVQLVISDFMMPGMNGAQFLREVKQRSPDTIRIMLTGHANTDAVMGAINEGAVYKFILKPWNDDDLRVTVALALEQFDLIARNRALKTENDKKAKEISALSGWPPPTAAGWASCCTRKTCCRRPSCRSSPCCRSAARSR